MSNRQKAGTVLEEGREVVLTRSQSSVLIKTDSKGTKSYEVKAYSDDVEEALAQAVKVATALDVAFQGGASVKVVP